MDACPACGNAVVDRIALTPNGNAVCLECGYVEPSKVIVHAKATK